ncbi:hypothetical protein [Thiohalophilus thiocyanatoxydans]|uniref:Uncharacterized protein n=1 Tax=Thiohalophilus thiocyanatoxydans TaxID=381308 RepID=A0A4R8IS95_9GAMM|nr:hypothetical protein [Thiohalophilus thiocyanatoxydans]TDY03836.1 hypothetical protein EDC23_0207 [Thiohalophilus thiocyanatoxydans]
MNNTAALASVLLESLQLILGVLLALVALYGLLLLIRPALGLRLNQSLSRRLSTPRFSLAFLDKQFHVERYFYRNAKLYGLLLVVGAGYLLYRLFFDFPLEGYASILPGILPTDIWAWLLDVLQIFLVVMAIFTLYIGLVVLIRPSNIKNLERHANRWISTAQKLAPEGSSPVLDSAAQRAPRLFGGVVFLAAIVVLFMLL